MAYPRVHEATETVFTHNGLGVLSECIRAPLTEELNGVFEIEIEHALDSRGKWLNLVEGNIIKADGQLFRIYHKKKTINSIVVNARHIFYDLLDNIVETLDLIGANGVAAITSLISSAQWASGFTVMGDHNVTGDFSFLRQNIVDCILGNDGITKTIGGELELDNKVIKIWNSRGSDRGVLISYGKNIVGIEETLDMDRICTRLMPVGKDDLLLAAKYVNASNIGNFVHPKIRIVEFNDIDNVMDLEAAAVAYFATTQCNIPTANYKIDFIELTKTEQYKNYAILESVALGDTVTVKHSVLGIDLKCKVIKTVKNCITDRIEEIELGSFNSNIASSISTQIQNLKSTVDFVKSAYQVAVENATNLITGETGGYVKIIRDVNTGEPEAIAIMDTDDVATAQKVWLWNNSGLGYSSTGIAGPYETAITSDGSIVATFITTGILDANIVKAGWNGIASTVKIDSTGLTVTNGAITLKNANNVDILAKTEDDINLQKLNTSGFTKVINGNFLDISSWTSDYSSLSVATIGELKCATAATKSATAGAEQPLTGLIVGHRYYITAEIMPLYSRASEWGFNGATKATITSPTINVWNKKSIITTATSTSHVLYLSHNTLAQYATNNVFRFRNVMVVDLDSIYGSNIPSLEWCGANISFSTLASGIVKAGFNDVSANILLDAEGITVTDGAIVVKNSNNDDAFYIDSNGRASTDSSFVEYDGTNGGGIQMIKNIIYKIPSTPTESKKLYLEADEGIHVKNATGYSGQGTVFKDMFLAGVNYNGMWQYRDNTWMYIDPPLKTGGELYVNGVINATGTKYRIVKTSHGVVGICAYEMADPMFGDIGAGKILNGECIVTIDPIFAETVLTDIEYHVFLQAYGEGNVYVSDRQPAYFVVKGTEGLSFSWEMKAKQVDNGNNRMKVIDHIESDKNPDITKYVDSILSAL